MILSYFDSQSALNLEVDCDIKIVKRELQLTYTMRGADLNLVELPNRSITPERLDDLWKETCFECFLKNSDSTEYIEFNFSPSGDWNCYFFDKYREGQNLLPLEDRPSTTLILNDECLEFRSRCQLPMPFNIGPHEYQLAVILKDENQKTHYLALTHAKDKPDFHNLDAFKKGTSRLLQETKR